MAMDSWQVKVKALIVVLSLVSARDCSAHADWWAGQVEEVRSLAEGGAAKPQVRSWVNKVLRSLGDEGIAVGMGESTRTSRSVTPLRGGDGMISGNSASKKEDNLLDLLDDHAATSAGRGYVTASPVPSIPAAPAPSLDDGSDMFAGMSMTDHPTSPTIPSQPSPLFDLLSAPAPTHTHAFSPTHAHTLAPAPALVPAPAPAPTSFDFLGGPVAASSPAPVLAHDPFAHLTSSAPLITPATTQSAQTQQPAQSSGFSFVSSAPTANKAHAISTAFTNENSGKPDTRNAFQEFSIASSAPPAAAPAPAAPIGGYTYGAAPVQSGYQPAAVNPSPFMGMSTSNPYSSQFGATNSPLAPAMLNPTAPRKAIPTADAPPSNSGFGFIAGGGGGAAVGTSAKSGGGDSFGFVTDAMKDLTKK